MRVSKHAKRQPRVVTLAFDGKFVGSLYEREGPLGHKRPACMLLFVFLRGGGVLFTATPWTTKELLSC